MNTFLAKDVKADVQQILNDTTVWTDAKLTVNINAAIRQITLDRPAARYTSPVAFTDGAVFVMTGSTGTAIADTDAVPLDVRWRTPLTHYVAFLCFNQSDRNTANAAFATEQLRLYKESL